MSNGQAQALGRLIKGYDSSLPVTVTVGHATFDLPDDYITFRIETKDGRSLYGGIDAEGGVST